MMHSAYSAHPTHSRPPRNPRQVGSVNINSEVTVSIGRILGFVALGMAIGYFLMVLLDLDESDRSKKKLRTPMDDSLNFAAKPPAGKKVSVNGTLTKRFADMSRFDQDFVQAGSVLMQTMCPRASGFLLAALEDFKTDQNEDGEDDL